VPRKGLKISLLGGGFHSADPGGRLGAGVSRFPPVHSSRGGRRNTVFDNKKLPMLNSFRNHKIT
jgi:hypothetical protein